MSNPDTPTTTYRERRAAKADRLRDWADSRDRKAEDAYNTSRDATAGIPAGQPILVGHHSQARHERALDRSWDALGRSVEHSEKARSMRAKADRIEAAARHAIYSDDHDAIERLTAKIEALVTKRDEMKARNAAFKKANKDRLKAEPSSFLRNRMLPHPSFEITNLTGTINRSRKRLAELEAAAG